MGSLEGWKTRRINEAARESALRSAGAADERARIRRELLEEIDPRLAALRARGKGAIVDPLTIHDSACIGLLSKLRRALDRICPEE